MGNKLNYEKLRIVLIQFGMLLIVSHLLLTLTNIEIRRDGRNQ